MIQGYRLWPQPGLLWRTALVTAAMKSISPSAVIIGPMLGIFMEGVLMELGSRVARGRWPGFVIGGALAVSWSLFQKILVLLVTFGFDLVAIYERLYFMAARTLGVESLGPFDLVQSIFIIDLIFGATVALVALRFSRPKAEDILLPDHEQEDLDTPGGMHVDPDQKFSLSAAGVNLMLIIVGLFLMPYLPMFWDLVYVGGFVAGNHLFYRESLHRARRPKLWLQLIGLMVLSGIILGGLTSWEAFLTGLSAGVSMVARAGLFIVGISALSTEMRNPVIMDWVRRHGFQGFFLALAYAFSTLPFLIRLIDRKRNILNKPLHTLALLLKFIEQEFDSERSEVHPTKIIFLTGNPGEGKTTLLNSILQPLREHGIRIGGILAPSVSAEGRREGYDLQDLHTDLRFPLCRRVGLDDDIQTGPYYFLESSLREGNKVLNELSNDDHDLIFLDEVGPLEMKGEGWLPGITAMLYNLNIPMVWVVRRSLLAEVAQRWHLDPFILDVKNTSPAELMELIEDLHHQYLATKQAI